MGGRFLVGRGRFESCLYDLRHPSRAKGERWFGFQSRGRAWIRGVSVV